MSLAALIFLFYGNVFAAHLAVGGSHTCAILDSGEVTCWGNNTFLESGFADPDEMIISPGRIVDLGINPKTKLPYRATAIGGSGIFTCAVLDDGNVTCWGSNSLGSLGISESKDH